jgi:hypothetical protein
MDANEVLGNLLFDGRVKRMCKYFGARQKRHGNGSSLNFECQQGGRLQAQSGHDSGRNTVKNSDLSNKKSLWPKLWGAAIAAPGQNLFMDNCDRK